MTTTATGRRGSWEWRWDWDRQGVGELVVAMGLAGSRSSCGSCIWIWNWSWSWSGQPADSAATNRLGAVPGKLPHRPAERPPEPTPKRSPRFRSISPRRRTASGAGTQYAGQLIDVTAGRRGGRRRPPDGRRVADVGPRPAPPVEHRRRATQPPSLDATLHRTPTSCSQRAAARPATSGAGRRSRSQQFGAVGAATASQHDAVLTGTGGHGAFGTADADAAVAVDQLVAQDAFASGGTLSPVGRPAHARRAGRRRHLDRRPGGHAPLEARRRRWPRPTASAGGLAARRRRRRRADGRPRSPATASQTAAQLVYVAQDASARATTAQQAGTAALPLASSEADAANRAAVVQEGSQTRRRLVRPRLQELLQQSIVVQTRDRRLDVERRHRRLGRRRELRGHAAGGRAVDRRRARRSPPAADLTAFCFPRGAARRSRRPSRRPRAVASEPCASSASRPRLSRPRRQRRPRRRAGLFHGGRAAAASPKRRDGHAPRAAPPGWRPSRRSRGDPSAGRPPSRSLPPCPPRKRASTRARGATQEPETPAGSRRSRRRGIHPRGSPRSQPRRPAPGRRGSQRSSWPSRSCRRSCGGRAKGRSSGDRPTFSHRSTFRSDPLATRQLTRWARARRASVYSAVTKGSEIRVTQTDRTRSRRDRARRSVDRTGRHQRVRQGLLEGERPGVDPERSVVQSGIATSGPATANGGTANGGAGTGGAGGNVNTGNNDTSQGQAASSSTGAATSGGISGGNTSSVGNDGGDLSNRTRPTSTSMPPTRPRATSTRTPTAATPRRSTTARTTTRRSVATQRTTAASRPAAASRRTVATAAGAATPTPVVVVTPRPTRATPVTAATAVLAAPAVPAEPAAPRLVLGLVGRWQWHRRCRHGRGRRQLCRRSRQCIVPRRDRHRRHGHRGSRRSRHRRRRRPLQVEQAGQVLRVLLAVPAARPTRPTSVTAGDAQAQRRRRRGCGRRRHQQPRPDRHGRRGRGRDGHDDAERVGVRGRRQQHERELHGDPERQSEHEHHVEHEPGRVDRSRR